MKHPYGSFVKCETVEVQFPPQHQRVQPGLEWLMHPNPISEDPDYKGSGKLKGKVAIVTGGDSGIGRAVSIAFAKEGADVVIVYLYEHKDAEITKKRIEELGRRCLTISVDLGHEWASSLVIERTIEKLGKIDVLVNNCGEQHVAHSIEKISAHQMIRTFQTNIFSFFYMTKAVLPHMGRGSSIVNTASITAYEGEKTLIDYSATKGAIVSFTRSLSLSLADQGIRVNGMAPGPIWTPLIPASFSAQRIMTFGLETPMKRAGQPYELAPAYVYLASDESSYMTGQVLHPNGGVISES
ncbi:MAG TPA: SDR family oxidoreductase [Bacillales bacterium]